MFQNNFKKMLTKFHHNHLNHFIFFISIYFLLTLINCESIKIPECQSRMMLLLFNKSKGSQQDGFSYLDQTGAQFSIKIQQKGTKELILKEEYNNDPWPKIIFHSIQKRRALSAYSENPNEYYAVIQANPDDYLYSKSSMIKIIIKEGAEDPDPFFNNAFTINQLISTIFFYGKVSIQYSYSSIVQGVENTDVFLQERLIDGITFNRYLIKYREFWSLSKYLPFYLIHYKAFNNKVFVIFSDGKWIFESLDEALSMTEVSNTKELKDDQGNVLGPITGLVCNCHDDPNDDIFYVLDGSYNSYRIIYNSYDDLSAKAEKNTNFSLILSSISNRQAKAAYASSNAVYYALSKEDDDYLGNPIYQMNRYYLFYGTETYTDVINDHPNNVHSLIFRNYNGQLESYIYYYKPGKIGGANTAKYDYYYHKSNANFDKDVQIKGFNLPYYIITAFDNPKDQLAVVVYERSTYTFNSINHIVSAADPKNTVLKLGVNCTRFPVDRDLPAYFTGIEADYVRKNPPPAAVSYCNSVNLVTIYIFSIFYSLIYLKLLTL